MEAIFLKILNMSITASWLVLAIVILRLILKKAPKAISVFMWALVGVRLICPFSFESILSLIPSAETVPQDIIYSEAPAIHSGVCWDEIQSSLDAMIDFSNPQIDRHIIRKFVSKIVPNGRNHFRWYMNLDGKDTTTLDMVTEGRKNNAVISFNDDEEDEPPLHIGDVIGLTELQQYFPNLLKNENQNGIITTVGKCGKKSSLDAILHRPPSKTAKKRPEMFLGISFIF